MTRRTSVRRGLALTATPAEALPEARTATAQTVRLALVWHQSDGVLTLTATTHKRGGSYVDSWSVSPSLALATETVTGSSPRGRPIYVSQAVAGASSLAPDTTYTFNYAIVMKAGGSTWVGSRTLTVTVGPDRP